MVAYSFKHRFVVPIRVGLGLETSFEVKPKRHTVRAVGKRRHARPGEEVQLYQGLRTKDCFLIGRAICTDMDAIKIVLSDTDFQIALNGASMMPSEIPAFAQADGFGDEHDMLAFWRTEYPGIEQFEGVVIKWRPAK